MKRALTNQELIDSLTVINSIPPFEYAQSKILRQYPFPINFWSGFKEMAGGEKYG